MSDRVRVVRNSCRGCHGVCQVLVHMNGDKIVRITGDPDSLTSRGFICPKGATAAELLYHPDRLKVPLRRAGKRGENKWQRITWEEALDEMTARFDAIRRESGPEYLAVAQGTGRPYTEFTMRFANAYGTPNFINPGHMCYLPRVIGSSITLGNVPVSDIYGFGGKMPGCILIWGCNIAATGAADGMCGDMLKKAMQSADKVIVIDPRRTGSAANADHWLQIRPGTDCALALAMINTIIQEDLYDHEFVTKYCFGFERLAEHVRTFTPEWAAPITRIPAETIRITARSYANSKPACLQWGNGVDTSINGFQTGRALLILMSITGNIDQPGGNVFWVPPAGIRSKAPMTDKSVTGEQFLPAGQAERIISQNRFPFAPNCHPPTFWQSVVSGVPYRVRGMWIIGSNPLVTATQGLTIEEALRDHLEYTVVSDLFMTPTAQMADLVLPAAHWLEQDDVVSMHKIWCVLSRKKLAQVGESRDDRDVIFNIAHRLGLNDAFPWPSRHSYLNWLLEGLGMSFDEFKEKDILVGEMTYRKFEKGEFFHTPSGKVELYSNVMESMGRLPLPVYVEPPFSQQSGPEAKYPLILVAGAKVPEFFHSEMHQIQALRRMHASPLVQIHSKTAAAYHILDGEWVILESPYGRAKLKAQIFDGIAEDVVYAEHAWWYPEEEAPEYRWKESCVNLLAGDRFFDPDTGAEPLKCLSCRITKASAAYPQGRPD
ncbi:MAG: anaerobic dehydrogenase, typically selenocysteine-containing [Firmicutes bacterium]|nr:anaerobic dehydrogenase, typically selenocysteine-containing [Bacillota bacterium]